MKNANTTSAKKSNKTAPVLHVPEAAAAKSTPSGIANFVAESKTVPEVQQVVKEETKIDITQTPEFKEALAFALSQRVPVITKAKAAKTPRVPRLEQNGIKRPKADSICGQIWNTLDTITANQKSPATIAQLREAYSANAATQQTQYAQWRQFNSITGRIVAPVKAVIAEDGLAAE